MEEGEGRGDSLGHRTTANGSPKWAATNNNASATTTTHWLVGWEWALTDLLYSGCINYAKWNSLFTLSEIAQGRRIGGR